METEQTTNKKLLTIIIVMSLAVFIIGLIMIGMSLRRTNTVPTQEVAHDDVLPTMPDDLDPDPVQPEAEKPVVEPKKIPTPPKADSAKITFLKQTIKELPTKGGMISIKECPYNGSNYLLMTWDQTGDGGWGLYTESGEQLGMCNGFYSPDYVPDAGGQLCSTVARNCTKTIYQTKNFYGDSLTKTDIYGLDK